MVHWVAMAICQWISGAVMKRELLFKEPEELADSDLCEILLERYKPPTIPPCRVCGGALSIQSCGGGHPTAWACSGIEDDPERSKKHRYKVGRKPADEHYSRSRFEDLRQGGDDHVLELIARFSRRADSARGEPDAS